MTFGLVGVLLRYAPFDAAAIAILLTMVAARGGLAARPPTTATLTTSRSRIARGDLVELTAAVSNRGRRRTSRALLQVGGPFALLEVAVEPLAAGAERDVVTTATADRRGAARIGPPRLTRTDWFELFRQTDLLDSETPVTVVPAVVPLRAPARSAGRASADLDGLFDGSVTFRTLRAYLPGDDLRRVHWPSVARTDQILIRTYSGGSEASFLVILDTRAVAYPDADTEGFAPSFEDAVDVAASVCAALLADGCLLRLWAGGRLLWPMPGPVATMPLLLEALAGLTLDGAQLREPDGRGRDSSAAALVVISGAGDDEPLLLAESAGRRVGSVLLVRLGADAANTTSGAVRVHHLWDVGHLRDEPDLLGCLTGTGRR